MFVADFITNLEKKRGYTAGQNCQVECGNDRP